MGSFYSTCSISDLSIIDGNEMYMQLLVPTCVTNPYSIDGEEIGCGEKGLRVANEGPLGEWTPFGFPIEGEYADYGNIDNIKKTRNIEILEEFFGISIQDIIACATDDRWYKYSYKPMIEDKYKEKYKNQFKRWTVGDNKMKYINILKKITVTYFNKKHYDFLTNEFIGNDGYHKNETVERSKIMLKLLIDLDEARPKTSKSEKEPFKISDITDKMRERYSCIKSETYTDENFDKLIIELKNHIKESWWKNEWDYKFYIPSLANTNMFKLLPIGVQDADEVQKQYRFIINMSNLYKVLRPSYYGSQEDNFNAYVKFHKKSVEFVNSVKLELKADRILDEISWVLKEGFKKIDEEKAEEMKKTIIEGLGDCGYKINL